jgi:hypothetical protein
MPEIDRLSLLQVNKLVELQLLGANDQVADPANKALTLLGPVHFLSSIGSRSRAAP